MQNKKTTAIFSPPEIRGSDRACEVEGVNNRFMNGKKKGIFPNISHLLVAIAFLLLASPTFAQQTIEWGVQGGSQGNDFVAGIVPVKNGMIATGKFEGDFQCERKSLEAHGGTDIFVMKLGKNGNPDWLHSLGGTTNDEATCIELGDEQFLVGGTINGTVTMDKEEFDGEGTAVFISSWSLSGKLNWLSRFPYSGHATTDAIQLFPDGSIMVGGMLQGTMDTGNGELKTPGRKLAWHVVINPAGETQSANLSSGTGNHRLKASALDEQNNQYLLYSTNGSMSFGKGNTVPVKRGSKAAVIMVKKDSQGNFLWGKSFSSKGFCETAGLAVGKDESVKISVNFNKELSALDTTIICKPQLKGVLYSLDKNGGKEWIKTIESNVNARVLDVMTNPTGKTLITGLFRHKFKAGELEFISNSSMGDLFLLQYNKDGEIDWHDFPAQDAANYCNTFALDDDGNILLGGGFRGELKFQSETMQSFGKKDIFLAKYFNCDQLEIQIDNAEPLCDGAPRTLMATAGFETYIWNGNEWGDRDYEISQPGVYTVTAYTKQGCSASDTVSIELADEADLGLEEEIVLFPGNTYTLTAIDGYTSYQWNDGQIGRIRDIEHQEDTEDHHIWLTAQTEHGCDIIDSVYVQYRNTEGQKNSLIAEYGLKLFPNPVIETLYWSSAVNAESLEVILYDNKSTQLFRKEIIGYSAREQHSVDMSGYPPGTYTFTLKLGAANFSEKVVKIDSSKR